MNVHLPENAGLSDFKNRKQMKSLIVELEMLDKACRFNLRMLETAKKLFQRRFYKFTIPPPPQGSEAENIRMYETHNPGFCYHHDGRCRASRRLSGLPVSSRTDLQAVRDMVMTDGEVDVEKLVCLHLLTVHFVGGRCLSEELSGYYGPSRWNRVDIKSRTTSRLLPTYVLSVTRETEARSRSRQRRSRSRSSTRSDEELVPVIINEQVERLVDVIMEVLQEVNPSKVQAIVELARKPAALRRVLAKPKIKDFLESLCGKELISSGEVFVVSGARMFRSACRHHRSPSAGRNLSATILDIESGNPSLEKIIEEIRSHVSSETNTAQRSSSSRLSLPGSNMSSLLWLNLSDRRPSTHTRRTLSWVGRTDKITGGTERSVVSMTAADKRRMSARSKINWGKKAQEDNCSLGDRNQSRSTLLSSDMISPSPKLLESPNEETIVECGAKDEVQEVTTLEEKEVASKPKASFTDKVAGENSLQTGGIKTTTRKSLTGSSAMVANKSRISSGWQQKSSSSIQVSWLTQEALSHIRQEIAIFETSRKLASFVQALST